MLGLSLDVFFFVKQKTAYELRISDWSSDVCSSDLQCGTPGINIGLFCSTPMVALSRAVPRKQAMEMLLTGDMIDAGEALRLGLVHRAVPAAAPEAEPLHLSRQVTSQSPLILPLRQEAIYRPLQYGPGGAYAYTNQVLTTKMSAAAPHK